LPDFLVTKVNRLTKDTQTYTDAASFFRRFGRDGKRGDAERETIANHDEALPTLRSNNNRPSTGC
jgi:hypothetical protein